MGCSKEHPINFSPLSIQRDLKASVPKAKTVRWTVFSESDNLHLPLTHAAVSELKLFSRTNILWADQNN